MTNKEEAKQEIRKLMETFSNIPSEELNRKPEEQIKFLFIEPLFKALGWEKEDIEKETRVLKGRADYILKIGNQEVLVIEAKKTSVNLTEDEGRQAVSYAYHRKIKFAVLTNFKEIRVYHALSNIKTINKNLLKDNGGYLSIKCDEFEKQFERLWLLSRESFEKGEMNKLLSAKDERLSKPIDESILYDLLQFREWLSKDLKKLRVYLTQEQIDEVVQILIDRLIFMRSVEDRGLEERDFLLNIVTDFKQGRTEKRLWESLKMQFRNFDREYNSKLFAEGLLEKEGFFDEKTLTKVIEGLYFGTKDHQERYMFDEIPGDLLGNIYEQYLGTILKGTEKRVSLDEESGKRKKMGIYYTPSYIVDYIVKNTVGEYVKNKSIDGILEARIVDPACGSGSFLIRAFREACDSIESRLKKGERSKKWSAFKDYKDRLNLVQKTTILTNCIYGVDLDEKAVELAQLNLLLRLLEDETKETKKLLLPNMKDNIKCGNSLIDDLSVSDKAFNWHAQFPKVFAQGGFDIVVGNPPYVDIKQLDPKLVKHLFSKYSTVENRMNLYSTFVERSLSLLRDAGYFGFIIPNSILYNESYGKIRSLLLDSVSMKKIIRLPDNVFGEAKVETIILVYQKSKGAVEKEKCEVFVYPREDNINSINKENCSQIFYINQNTWKTGEKIFNISANQTSNKILANIEKETMPLIEICDFSLGLTPYDKYKGHTKKQIDERVFHSSTKKDETYKPLLSGENIIRYGIFWDGKEYIRYGDWLGAPREKRFFKKPRIVVRQIISGKPARIYAGYTEEELYNTQIGFDIIVKDESVILIKYVLAILNSNLMNFYHKEKFLDPSKNLFQKILIANAKKFPIKIVPIDAQKKIIALVDKMLALQKKYREGKIAGNEKELLEQQIRQTDWQIDQEVYKLYGITEEERKVIEGSLK